MNVNVMCCLRCVEQRVEKRHFSRYALNGTKATLDGRQCYPSCMTRRWVGRM
jgi:hypothetical protein